MAQQVIQEFDRRRISPMQVVEHEHERLPRRQLCEQRAYCPMHPVALLRQRCETAAGIGQGRKHGREAAPLGLAEVA